MTKHKLVFDEMFKITNSVTKALEMTLLVAGMKNCVRQGYYEDEMREIEKFCRNHKIHFSLSKYKVDIKSKIKNYESTGVIGNKGMHFAYFAMDEKTPLMANYYETTQNHKEFGKILGYPECCTNFFTNEVKQNNFHPVHEPTNKFTDLSKLHQDVALISHFPCSSECPHSIEIGKTTHEFINNYLPEIKHFFN